MYIGSTGQRGLHHLVYEVVDNAVDEAMAGHNDPIEVTIHPDNSVTVRDRGRGIPVDDDRRTRACPALTVVLTKLHAGGKFGGEGYKVSGGLHGVGVSVVNALSEWLIAEVERDGKIYRQEFARGVPQGEHEDDRRSTSETGTTISFLPDAEIFEEIEFSAETLVQRLRETAFLTRGLRITLTDERAGGEHGRVPLRGRDQGLRRLHQRVEGPVHRHIVYFESESDAGYVEVAMQWNTSYQESVFSFANNINTHEGGTHMQGFRSALTRTLNKYARDKGLLKEKEDNLEGEDVREGLAAVISVKLQNPQFEGQTKTKLGNPRIAGLVESTVNAEARGVPRGEPDRRAPDHQQGDRRVARAPRRPQGARADAPQVGAREHVAARASSPTARSTTPSRPSSSSSRATPPAARPSRAATAATRRSCRCAGRSSTARRTASTRCSRTTRSRR